jgi:excisionase family DNA binding protein
MAQTDARKQEFVSAVAIVAAVLAERWYEGWGSSPMTVSAPSVESSSDPLLNRKEAAKMLRISVATLARKVKAGDLRPVNVSGKAPRYRREDIERLIRRL